MPSRLERRGQESWADASLEQVFDKVDLCFDAYPLPLYGNHQTINNIAAVRSWFSYFSALLVIARLL